MVRPNSGVRKRPTCKLIFTAASCLLAILTVLLMYSLKLRELSDAAPELSSFPLEAPEFSLHVLPPGSKSLELSTADRREGEDYTVMPFKAKGTHDVVGIGGGGGGRFGSRTGGHSFAEAADASRPISRSTLKDGTARLRAGETDDNAKFADYLRYFKAWTGQGVQKVDITDRMVLSFVNKEGLPVSNAPVRVLSGGESVLCGITTAAGELLFAPKAAGIGDNVCRFTAELDGQKVDFQRRDEVQVSIDVSMPERECIDVDVGFCLDTTGSMTDEIDAIKRTLRDVTDRLDRLRPRPRLRYGMVLYRDRGDEYVTRSTDFISNLNGFLGALDGVRAAGGGDFEEAVSEALCRSVRDLSWRAGDAIRVLFLIGDAAPHTDYADGFDYSRAMKEAAAKGIKIFTVGASGLDGKGEFIWRQVAQFTLAKFLFISYSGNTSHHVGAYKENNLDDLMLRGVTGEVESLRSKRAVPPRARD